MDHPGSGIGKMAMALGHWGTGTGGAGALPARGGPHACRVSAAGEVEVEVEGLGAHVHIVGTSSENWDWKRIIRALTRPASPRPVALWALAGVDDRTATGTSH
eukprot:scaffold843_cov108-Isochrysis_galbana.AAC.5